jgi:hypothetical protein
MKIVVSFFLVVTSVSLVISSRAVGQPGQKASGQGGQALSARLYLDPKGFFEIRPPNGWEVHEYSNDPRGKVDFRIAPNGDWSQSGAELKVIGRKSILSSIDAVRSNAKDQADRLRTRLGASIEVTETTLFSLPAVQMNISIPGKLLQEVLEVLIGANHYTFLFGAPHHRYKDYRPIAMKSIETFRPLLGDLPQEEAIRHLVASHLRRAELYRQMGQTAWALEAINDGLAIDPSNAKLLQMKKEFEAR